METRRQVALSNVKSTTVGVGLSASVVVLINYFSNLNAPDYVLAAGTTVVAAIFGFIYPFLPEKDA